MIFVKNSFLLLSGSNQYSDAVTSKVRVTGACQCFFFFLRENKSNAWNRFSTFFWLFSRNETIFHARFSGKFHGQYEIFTHTFHKLFTYCIFFFTGTFWKNFTYWILFSRTKTLRIFTQSSFIFTHILSYYQHICKSMNAVSMYWKIIVGFTGWQWQFGFKR